jgi:epoxyqueuosine reductase
LNHEISFTIDSLEFINKIMGSQKPAARKVITKLSSEIIVKAESLPGIKAGIARLEDILKAPSYQVVPEGEWSSSLSNEEAVTEWPADAKSVLILGFYHPEDEPQLDWWDGGNTMGNRRLIEISGYLKKWLKEKKGLSALALPYHVERGGLFLKDAAVIAGLGIVGRSNLLLNPEWGPRIRFRSILIEETLEPTGPIEGFSPCESCSEICHSACPKDAFSTGVYCRPDCTAQLNADIANKMRDGRQVGEDGEPNVVIKYCRACELVCPAGE